jgi:hypothetical protein
MLLADFFPRDLRAQPDAGIQELLRAILIRSNFVPAVRHHLGWRGLKQVAAYGECWTAKISEVAGVFGLYFNGLEPSAGWFRGRFLLYYFPDPNEDLVEDCSLQAAALIHSPHYLDLVREFSLHLDFRGFFAIGLMGLAADTAGKALALDLESLSVQRLIATDGVVLTENGQQVTLVEPGGSGDS